jgi:hypothetical protein
MWVGLCLLLFTVGFYVLARADLSAMTEGLQERLQTLAPPVDNA